MPRTRKRAPKPERGIKPDQRPRHETPLSKWLEKKGMTFTAFARAAGVDPKSVQLWSHGQIVPNLVWAFKMELFTRGEVPASAWLLTPLAKERWDREGSEDTRTPP